MDLCILGESVVLRSSKDKKGVEMGNGSEKKLMGGGREKSKMLEKTPVGIARRQLGQASDDQTL